MAAEARAAGAAEVAATEASLLRSQVESALVDVGEAREEAAAAMEELSKAKQVWTQWHTGADLPFHGRGNVCGGGAEPIACSGHPAQQSFL